jgi:hypothetical protein
MMEPQAVQPPSALRDAVRRDLHRVSRLRSPARRAVGLVPLAGATLVCAVAVFSMRRDATTLGWWLTWGASATQVGLGVWLIALALRDAIPGREVRTSLLVTAITLVLGFSAGLTLETWHVSPVGIRQAWGLITTECFVGTWVMALPLLLGAVLMVSRAFPTRPSAAGLLAGLGAGAASDAGWRLFCHFTQPAHVLLSHTAGLLAAGMAGALLARTIAPRVLSQRQSCPPR